MPSQEPIPFVDEHGQPCYRVPISNAPGMFAIVDRHSYAALQDHGLAGAWLLNDNGTGRRYVRTPVPTDSRSKGTILLMARLIIGAGPGTVVRYANGDPLDLRLINLTWRKGKSRRTDSDILTAAVRLRADSRPNSSLDHTPPNTKETHAHLQ